MFEFTTPDSANRKRLMPAVMLTNFDVQIVSIETVERWWR
jgi:hypothetical protein